ncbi:MAG: FlgD immunoglobulin-like domain containing protein [bacterium]|nr:FlgD immunoglobulin-like domain containing protein [bacterium]
MNRIVLLTCTALFFVGFSSSIGQPLLPSDFWGAITINNQDAPVGTMIIPTINGVAYPASYTIKTSGIYGLLSVSGDDPGTPNIKEGGVNGDKIVFIAQIEGVDVTLTPEATFFSSETQQVDLQGEAVIPVELAAFSAKTSGQTIKLNWTTISESNNFGFEIQRSEDKILFVKRGFVEGNGTTTSPNSYQFTDSGLISHSYFYRLKQIDYDGGYQFSDVLEVILQPPQNCVLAQNYPNPFNPETRIDYSIPHAGNVTIEIFDINGRLVRQLISQRQSAGFYQVNWHGKDQNGRPVANGLYCYIFSFDNKRLSRKMILMR